MKDDGYGERLKDPVFWMGFWAWRRATENKGSIWAIICNGQTIGITVRA